MFQVINSQKFDFFYLPKAAYKQEESEFSYQTIKYK